MTFSHTSGGRSAGPSDDPQDEDAQPDAGAGVSAGAFSSPKPRMLSSEITLPITHSFPAALDAPSVITRKASSGPN